MLALVHYIFSIIAIRNATCSSQVWTSNTSNTKIGEW